MKQFKALVACEESQAVTIALRKLGWEAYSCDIQECSGGHPEWHICESVIPLVNGDCMFKTMDGKMHSVQGKWDLLIAHPPCTYLTVTGNRWFNVEKYGEKAIQRAKDREEAIAFFMVFANANCDHICIENPVGCMSTRWRKADQIIQPWMFGDNFAKSTCLWEKGVPPLVPEVAKEPEMEYLEWVSKKTGKPKRQAKWYQDALRLSPEERAKVRSKTFPGVARKMAETWGTIQND
jgi:hypothetical protein